VLAGAAKSGTSTLAEMLGAHPRVHMCPRKESHHYLFRDAPPRFTGPGDDMFARMVVDDPVDWKQLMADADASGATAVGESAVYYLYRPEVWPVLARELGPDGKVVLILRDPVARVVSAWGHMVRDGREVLDLAEALAAEDERVAAGWEWCWHLTRVSRYHQQLPAVYAAFSPDRVFVADFAELRRDPTGLLVRLQRFLGVDEVPPAGDVAPVVNPSGQVRNRSLHRFLTEPHPVKDLLRPLVPDRLVQGTYRRALSRNLRPLPPVPDDLRHRLADELATEAALVHGITGLDTSAWTQ
jgi:hypothetical protein